MAGRSKSRAHSALLGLDGPELEDIAHQAAAGALMAISERLDRFRGEARFATWASKFVCPVVGDLIEHNSEYADLIDPMHPGATKGHRRPSKPHR